MKKLTRIQNVLKKEKCDAFVVTNLKNIRYLSGFSGSTATLIIFKDSQFIATDFRYIEQVRNEVDPAFELKRTPQHGMLAVWAELLRGRKMKVMFESDAVNYAMYQNMEKLDLGELVPSNGIVESLRMYKTSDEIKAMKKAISIANNAFLKLIDWIKPGQTEREIAAELCSLCLHSGADKFSFDPIIASGPHSAIPHHQPKDRKVLKKDIIKIDFGVYLNGYASDMTRTVFVGNPSEKMKNVYNIVKNAQEAAFASIKPGVECSAVDKAARDLIEKEGYGECFGHGLGHGIGLDVHEAPSFSVNTKARTEKGMTLSVEPGIYIPGEFGVRIEDLIVIADNGYENLTCIDGFSHKDIIVL